MILLIDIGNTRLKWAMLEGSRLSPQQAVAYAGWAREDMRRQLFQRVERPLRVLVSNVGGVQIEDVVRDAAQEEWGIPPEFYRSTAAAGGVRNAYPEPANLGVDRWLAVIAAHEMHPRELVCVASIGTATTVDAVDSSGRHLGGAIVPGPELMVTSLMRGTSDIAIRSQGGVIGQALFADNTLGAVNQGAVHAIAALIERAVGVLRSHSQTPPVLLLSGGGCSSVEKLVNIPFATVPDLVLRGLSAVASARDP